MLAMIFLTIMIISCRKILMTDKGARDGNEGARRSLISDETGDAELSAGDSGT